MYLNFSREQQLAIDNCDSNIYMAAGPGSGKSTTLAEIARRLHNNPSNNIFLITFTNKSAKDILGKVGLEESKRIRGGTFHSLAYRLMKEGGVSTSICDENKKRLIIKKIFNCRKDKKRYEEIYEAISRAKSVYPEAENKAVERYNEELCHYSMMDFDDIISKGIEFIKTQFRNPGVTHILVDELQDTSQAQLEMLKVLAEATGAKMLGVGDLDQCHPAGNKILTTDGLIDIKDIDPNKHKVMSYDGHGNIYGLNKPYGYSIQKSIRKYTGNIYKFNVNNNIFTVTSNHKMYVKWNKKNISNKYCTYIMRRGKRYRLGQCKLFNDDGYFHLGIRSRIEEADESWILDVYDTKKESLFWEACESITYNIPTLTFKANETNANYDQNFIDDVYDSVDDERTLNDVKHILCVHKRDINYPFWSRKEKHKKQTGSTYMITQACNVIPELMTMSEISSGDLRGHNVEMDITFVENIDVYSLNVEKFHNYFCENILVSNSIYEWRGARPENVREFINTFNCDIYQLGLNFRSKVRIVEHSKKLIANNTERIQKNLRAFSEENGSVMAYRAKDLYKEIDYIISYCRRNRNEEIAILYRTRMNKMKLEYELRKARIPYRVNDSTDIVDRSAFRVLLGMLRMACGIYDIYDLEEVAKGMKALGKTAVEKVRELQKDISTPKEGEQTDLFAKPIDTFDDLIKHLHLTQKGMKRPLSNILKLQKKFKELKGSKMDVLVRQLPDFCIKSFDIPEEILSFLIDVTKEFKLSILNIRELCNDFGLNNSKEESDDDANIELSTIHGYKGGERDIVVVPFCNWDIKDDDKVKDPVESERRLFYVAITRPKNKLLLTYSSELKPRFVREAEI